jgi:hypothetical protein
MAIRKAEAVWRGSLRETRPGAIRVAGRVIPGRKRIES